jgi:ribosomal-protein-serine acetyltransferase
MFCHKVNEHIELRLIERQHTADLFKVIDSNREHLSRWHPWMDAMRTAGDVEKAIVLWQQQYAGNRGFCAGIWFRGRLCGAINHLNVDWVNRCAILSYWLDEQHQGRGIMTACCRAFISHAFNTWNLNRITIECATENKRSRAIPERLGFRLEGIVRGVEWLHGKFADHALYGLLRSDHVTERPAASQAVLERAGDRAAIGSPLDPTTAAWVSARGKAEASATNW